MAKGTSIKYTEEELTWIKQRRKMPRKKAHAQFCKTFLSDVSFDNYKALCTRRGWTTGRTGYYKKGCVSWNEGKKMPYNTNSAKTQFKKGRKPHNTHYIGHERITKDGYIEISVAKTNPYTGHDTRYVLKHRHLWEEKNGKLPEGMCLKCLDGNRQNTRPSNWGAIPRGALPFLNGHRGHSYEDAPAELKPTILMLAKVKHAKAIKVRRK